MTVATALGTSQPVVRLRLQDDALHLAVTRQSEPTQTHALPLGVAALVQTQLRDAPPTALEVENAIAVIEDAVMPLHRLLPPGARLESDDGPMRELALVCGVPPSEPMVWTLEALESSFNLLASVVMGSPAAQAGVPLDAASVARLLVLRECLHHWGFDALVFLGA